MKAFGGFAGVIPELKGLIEGIDMADSLTLDGESAARCLHELRDGKAISG